MNRVKVVVEKNRPRATIGPPYYADSEGFTRYIIDGKPGYHNSVWVPVQHLFGNGCRLPESLTVEWDDGEDEQVR